MPTAASLLLTCHTATAVAEIALTFGRNGSARGAVLLLRRYTLVPHAVLSNPIVLAYRARGASIYLSLVGCLRRRIVVSCQRHCLSVWDLSWEQGPQT